MSTKEMHIKQVDNGWILNYMGGDCLHKERIYTEWSDVVKLLDEYFGWYRLDSTENLKKNPYGEVMS